MQVPYSFSLFAIPHQSVKVGVGNMDIVLKILMLALQNTYKPNSNRHQISSVTVIK